MNLLKNEKGSAGFFVFLLLIFVLVFLGFIAGLAVEDQSRKQAQAQITGTNIVPKIFNDQDLNPEEIQWLSENLESVYDISTKAYAILTNTTVSSSAASIKAASPTEELRYAEIDDPYERIALKKMNGDELTIVELKIFKEDPFEVNQFIEEYEKLLND